MDVMIPTGKRPKPETVQTVKRFVEAYARAKGYALCPDPVQLRTVIEGLALNQELYGYRYCPCRPVTGDLLQDRDKICPCRWHEEEIRKTGRCHCGLFWDPKKARMLKDTSRKNVNG